MIEWTFRNLPANDINWRPVGTSFSGPTSLSGRTRFVETSGGGSWLCDITSPIYEADQVRLARALRNILNGGAAPLILRTCECGYAPYPAGSESGGVPFSDSSTFSDGTLFAGWRINIYAAAASIHANTLTLDIQAASTDLVGSAFSIVYQTLGEHRHEIVG
ncbi:MAG TPA: hypothetical protein VLZ84_11705, partial [Asticcacaulis sp.]|nr:hypothetical protein [Asticcacaulis sp.]